jgi:hypothetical protein
MAVLDTAIWLLREIAGLRPVMTTIHFLVILTKVRIQLRALAK